MGSGKTRHLISTILLGLTFLIPIYLYLTIIIMDDASSFFWVIMFITLFEIVIFILNIFAFWKIDLNKKLIKTSDILNIIIGAASVGWTILILVLMKIYPNQDVGFGFTFNLLAPYLLLIPSIIFLIGYFKKN